MIRILSWNILQGGGRRAEGIAKAIIEYQPHIVTLQEFRRGSGAETILAALEKAGLTYQHIPETVDRTENTILIASRYGFDAGPFMPERESPLALLEAAFSEETLGFPLTMLAVHFPQKKPQVPLFNALIDESASLLAGDTLLIGDLNCGIPMVDSMTDSFYATRQFQHMLEIGWIDAWRSRHENVSEFTWYSAKRKHGFRYDQILASQKFNDRISNVRYDHKVREEGLSDHSAVIVKLTAP